MSSANPALSQSCHNCLLLRLSFSKRSFAQKPTLRFLREAPSPTAGTCGVAVSVVTFEDLLRFDLFARSSFVVFFALAPFVASVALLDVFPLSPSSLSEVLTFFLAGNTCFNTVVFSGVASGSKILDATEERLRFLLSFFAARFCAFARRRAVTSLLMSS